MVSLKNTLCLTPGCCWLNASADEVTDSAVTADTTINGRLRPRINGRHVGVCKPVIAMGQILSGYRQVSHIVKHPVDTFEAARPQREAAHGPCDFVLKVQETKFQCHKSVLMASSRYFETMLTMFDERDKSEVELKDIVDAQIMALSLHFLYNNDLVPLKRKNVHDLLQLAIYLQIQSLQSICCKYLQV